MYSEVVNCEMIDRLPTLMSPRTTTFQQVAGAAVPYVSLAWGTCSGPTIPFTTQLSLRWCRRLKESPRFLMPPDDVEKDLKHLKKKLKSHNFELLKTIKKQ